MSSVGIYFVKKIAQTICYILLITSAFAQKREFNHVTQLDQSLLQLNQMIIPAANWDPYPELRNPEKYQAVPINIKQAYIKAAEKLLHKDWKPISATSFLEYNRNGNRTHYEDLSFARRRNLATLVLAEVFGTFYRSDC
jgi:hypothetical protein